LASANGNAIASACRNSIVSSDRNFFRAISSIGGLRSVAISLVVTGNRSRSRRVTMPVPAPVSSTREGA
jgi:hypothetical protein